MLSKALLLGISLHELQAVQLKSKVFQKLAAKNGIDQGL